MPKAASIPATRQSHSVRRGQQLTVAGITLIPLGRDRFHVIAPVGCRIEVEPAKPIDVESATTTHPSDRREP